MPPISPKLIERDFDGLMDIALKIIESRCPDWQTPTPSDPGIVLLEVFAHLTEILLYQFNSIPDKVYQELIKLLGIQRHPPAAASVGLKFTRTESIEDVFIIPEGTEVCSDLAGGSDTSSFFTEREVVMASGIESVEVDARHCRYVTEELIGVGTGQPGLSLNTQYSPIVMAPGGNYNVVVGVEVDLNTETPDKETRIIGGKTFEIWEFVENILDCGLEEKCYSCNRIEGIIQFPYGKTPSSYQQTGNLAGVIKKDREVRIWYPTGGGASGNVEADVLTILKDQKLIAMTVTNPKRAMGGVDMESYDDLISRAPTSIHSTDRIITAGDYEHFACQHPLIQRAKAINAVSIWKHGKRGLVNVYLVPGNGNSQSECLKETDLLTGQNQQTLNFIQDQLYQKIALGTHCEVKWAPLKPIRVHAKITVKPGVSPEQFKKNIQTRLGHLISPLPTSQNPRGIGFGDSLYVSELYHTILKEKGIASLDSVFLEVKHAPEKEVVSICFDPFLSSSWYAVCKNELYRSVNNGLGWELQSMGEIGRNLKNSDSFKGIEPCEIQEGCFAVISTSSASNKSSVIFTLDNGDSWSKKEFAFIVRDIAWAGKRDQLYLLLATDRGLYKLPVVAPFLPEEVELCKEEPSPLGLYAVKRMQCFGGQEYVIVASQNRNGVYISSTGSQSGEFKRIGFKGKDIRTIALEQDGNRYFLWLGETVIGNEEGNGIYRLELAENQLEEKNICTYGNGWKGGSCKSIAVFGSRVISATHRSGILTIEKDHPNDEWQLSDIDCGLPVRDIDRIFAPIESIAVNGDHTLLMIGGPNGIYSTTDANFWSKNSDRRHGQKITLPPEWLFCSDNHKIQVIELNEKG